MQKAAAIKFLWSRMIMSLIAAAAAVMYGPATEVFAQAEACASPVAITQVQTGASPAGSSSANFRYEFVELYNCTNQPASLAGLRLQLKNAAGAATTTVPLDGVLAPQSFAWALHNSYKTHLGAATPSPAFVFAVGAGNLNALAAEGGSVALLDGTGVALETVSYGDRADQAPVPPSGLSIKRCSLDGNFASFTNVSEGFVLTSLPTLSSLFTMGPPCSVPEPPPVEDPPLPDPPKPCRGLVLSEILPNPAGADSGKEFIEVHNPTSAAIDLLGCSLRLNDGEPFALPDEVLPPGAYLAFYDTQTGITLPNSAGGTVWLLNAATEEEVSYQAALGEDMAWALLQSWQATSTPTPNTINALGVLINQEDEPVPCKEGQERNPSTGRCRMIAVEATPQPCKAGQERNPETGRCRTVITPAAATPCKPGQERNAETNRCRSIAVDSPQPCAEGQERNPETGRCRKVLAADLPKTVEDAAAPQSTDPKWWLAGAVAAGVMGYGIYEWRHDITKSFGKLKSRARRRSE